ncbi:MAG: hypothetical protein Rubg2KO_22300 [Rubricoccaceae bacterium]
MLSLIRQLVPHTDDVEAYHQGTLLVLACILTGLFSVLYAVLDALSGLWVGVVTMSVSAVLFFALPPVFRFTRSVSLVAHLFLGLGTTTILVNAQYTGGVEVLVWLAAIPIAAMLTLKGREAEIWVVVAVVAAGGMAGLEALGHQYHVTLVPSEQTALLIGTRAGLPAIIYFLTLVFRTERERASQALRTQNEDLQTALHRLERTQDRLVQHEKLAALGQVTAGIAHEIRNPLNFVSNFSGLNQELADDLQQAIVSGNPTEALELAQHVRDNAERVHHHGERAEAIVRSMLALADRRTSPRQRVGVNPLVADAVARAVNDAPSRPPITVEESYDGLAGTMDVTPEEVERAVRHVVDNAIYAARNAAPRLDGPPRVSVETVASPDRVAIRIRDNGAGVAEADRERLFEPFYTTKPAGEGAGLGLALTYDVIVTRHAGAISVDSKDGEGTMITLSLPAATAPLSSENDLPVGSMA